MKIAPFLCFSLLILLTALPAPVQASVFINDVIGRYLPTIKIRMEPGAYEKFLILPGNDDNSGGLLVMSFAEEREFFGFSALICNEENAKKYEARDKAQCFRKEIDVKSDVFKYKFKGSEKYYLFIVNRSQPLRTKRDITVTTYAHTALTPAVRERLKGDIDLIQEKLNVFFDTTPINYGVVPCDTKFVPSSTEQRTVTVCSELMLGRNMVPDKDMLLSAVFYQIVPILEKDWKVDEVNSMMERLQFTTMLTMLFSETKDPFNKFVNLFEEIPEIYNIMQKYPQHEEDLEYLDYFNKLISISNDPFSSIDHWLNMAYDHMEADMLERIKAGDLRHFGVLRNSARLVLKRRYEQELEANKVKEEPKNIISDFW